MTQNKKIIAITGGIGSGKSTVSSILKEWGYNVFSCDEVYAELLKDRAFIGKIEEKLGNVSKIDGTLDRALLSQKVFSDEEARKTLDEITHPAIMAEMLKRAKTTEGTAVFCEVPLLFENGFEKLFDNVIVVKRDEKSRIDAVIKRSGLTEEEVRARIAAQFEYDKIPLKDYFIINNDDDISVLRCTMCDIISLI